MHDLNTINKINFDAFAKSIDAFRANGRFVLAHYEGAHLVGIETFSNADLASDAHYVKVSKAGAGEHYIVMAPTQTFYAAQRDQSEDRAALSFEEIAALGAGTPAQSTDVTLADYIARKTASV